MTKIHNPSKRYQPPTLFDWANEKERRGADHRVRWVAKRCGVSLATAATLASNAGLFDREDR